MQGSPLTDQPLRRRLRRYFKSASEKRTSRAKKAIRRASRAKVAKLVYKSLESGYNQLDWSTIDQQKG